MPSQVRAPRATLIADGISLAPIECSVQVSLHQSADTFFAKLPLDNAQGLDETYWANQAPIDVTIEATNGDGASVELFTGQVDKIVLDLANRTVQMNGRDKTALLIDSKTHEQFLNKSDQDVITDLAGRVGLSVQFSADDTGSDKAGLQYKDDFNRLTDLDSYWNVIVKLAKKVGCVAFVKQRMLYIQPVDQESGSIYRVFYQRPSPHAASNAKNLVCVWDHHLSKGVKVNHQSWRHKQGKKIESEFEAKGKGKSLLYTFRGANLTKDQQDRIAKSKVREATSHERTINLELPGDVNIDPQKKLELSGTGTAFDQAYFISQITHRFDMSGGYQMTLAAHAPDASRSEPTQNK